MASINSNDQQEFEDIILFHLFKGDEKYNYEDITYLPSQYGFEISRDELKSICTNLGDERKLNWKETPDRIEAKLLFAGHSYARDVMQPLIVNQKEVPFERLSILLKEQNKLDDFEFVIENGKEGISVNHTPKGKFSENYFRAVRLKFLYFSIASNPKVKVVDRREFTSVIHAFREWTNLLTDLPTDTAAARTQDLPNEVRSELAFVVGGYWSGDDQSQRFMSEGIWENAKDEGDDSIMHTVQVGDTFVLKSTFSKERNSLLRIKGVGKVTGRLTPEVFSVNWTIRDISIDIENLGFYRKTIEQIKHDDWILIEDRIRHHFAKNLNVNLQLDSVSDIDLLDRKPFAKAVGDYVSRLWLDQEEHAYTIHLSGEWGSGKSNVLRFLASDLENRDWYVLHYNAWEYQHIENPWWMFSNKIYKQLLSKLGLIKSVRFWITEFLWRLFVINKLSWFSFLFISVLALIFFKMTISETSDASWKESETNWLSLVGTILTTGGSLWLLFKSISGSLLPASDESAQNFQKNINDPIDLIRTHFQSMVKFPKKDIAIFIDDIDRCSSKNVVKLLEGIQTIFKSTKVLYVFAGDASWVRRCFEIEYEGFAENFKKPGHSLGNFFVEKVFQMSINIPVITRDALKSFLKQTLSPDRRIEKNNKVVVKSILLDFKNKRDEIGIESVLAKYRGTENEQLAIEMAMDHISNDETMQDIGHELEAYYSLLPGNVRSVKRFINNYAIARQTLLLQRVSFNAVPMEVLVRWLILVSLYPMLAEELMKRPALITGHLRSSFDDIFESLDFQNLTKNFLTEEKIKLIVGK
jgi:hypothetical protein